MIRQLCIRHGMSISELSNTKSTRACQITRKKRSKQLIKPRETWIQPVRNLLSHERYRCLCGWFRCFRNLNSFRLRSLQNANKYHIPQAKSLHTSLRYWLGYMHSPVTLKNIAHHKRPKKSLKYFLHQFFKKQYKWFSFQQCLGRLISENPFSL